MPKKIEPICKNCRLYDDNGTCRVIILVEGKKINIPVDPDDRCFFEKELEAGGTKFIPAEEIKQVKFWVEDKKTGKKTDGNGVVKMEYPEGFFGQED